MLSQISLEAEGKFTIFGPEQYWVLSFRYEYGSMWKLFFFFKLENYYSLANFTSRTHICDSRVTSCQLIGYCYRLHILR